MTSTNEHQVIEVERFSFAIGKKPILRDVSFSVRRGEYLSIIGPNGAGKTTLLKCLDRIYRGGTGRIVVFDRPLSAYTQKELARRLSYVPQADGRVFPYTVEQFILMGRYPYISPFSTVRAEDRSVVQHAMETTGLIAFSDRLLATLSGGERQKVYIAAALAQEADVLLLDEPTTFLDYRHQTEIRELLARANRDSGVTIVSVTHDVNRAVLDGDRILAMRDGEIVYCDRPEAIMRPEVLETIYDTPFVLVDHPRADLPVIVPDRPNEQHGGNT